MGSLNGVLYSSLAAIQANAAGLATVNHNIANVNTPGFSRQQVNLATSIPLQTAVGNIGTGVKVDSITAFRDRFVEARLNQETSTQGQFASLSSGAQQLENIFNETGGGGLSSDLNSFFNSFSNLANDPSSGAARNVLLQQGQTLAGDFTSAADHLQSLQKQADSSINDSVSQINSLATQIGQLNQQIAATERPNEPANDLRDQRSLLLNQLSQLANINSVEDPSGSVVVTIGSGRTLVAGNQVEKLSTNSQSNGLSAITLDGTDITGELNNGSIAGLLSTRDSAVPQAQAQLDNLAALITQKVNAQHASGVGLDGSTGVNFFVPAPTGQNGNSGAARAFAVDPAIIKNVNKIAASQTGAAGDNTNALALGNLQTQVFNSGAGSGTFNQLYSSLVGQVGSLSSSAQQNSTIQSAVVLQVQNQRNAVSGVSLDEESANLLTYQRSYQAASQVITVVDELTQTMLGLIK